MAAGKVDVAAAFAALGEFWSPRVVARVNDQYVKVAKLSGPFVWHAHEDEDELFWVIRGELTLEFDDGSVRLREGELFVVPRGKRHRPVASDDCWVVLVETVTTKHTGDVVDPRTRSIEEQLDGS